MMTAQEAEAALYEWATRRKAITGQRRQLVADAWTEGTRNIALLARTAGVSRGTIYADLRSCGIDPIRHTIAGA